MPWVYDYKLDKIIEFESKTPCCISCLEEQEDGYSGAIDECCCCRHSSEYRGKYEKI